MSTLKLLVVEDVLSIQKIIDRALPDSVFEKRFAGDGGKALEVYKAWHPDIILLDVMLPVMTGFSVLKEIRTNIRDKSTTIIIQTSITEKSHIIQFMKLGIQGYVVKPFDQTEIGRKILKYYGALEPEKAKAALEQLEQALSAGHLEVPAVVEKEAETGEPSPVADAEYLEEFQFCLQAGNVTENERRMLDRHRKRLGISKKRAAELEQGLCQGMKQTAHPREEEYIEEVKFCLEKGPVTEGERRILNRLRDKLGISEGRAVELEKGVGAG